MGTGRTLSLALVLAAVWLLLSGHYEPLILAFGVASVAFVVLVARRKGLTDREGHPIDLLFGGLRYWPWLLVEMAKSNLAVARCILHPRMPISPTVIKVPASQRTDLGRVVFANSITLTPGTVSIIVERDTVVVHALTADAARDLAEGGEMNRRVTRMEGAA
jgi:multicomponent Na+:H+ antiporter subunit E